MRSDSTFGSEGGTGFTFTLRLVFLVSVALLGNSCMPLFRSQAVVTGIETHERDNGFVVQLTCGRTVGDVSAFISADNWLVITLVGTGVDFDRLRSTPPNDLFSSVQVVGYQSSVQVTLKLRQQFRSCDVVANPQNDDVLISLFAR